MPSLPTRSPWDFSDALKLLHSNPSEKLQLPVLHEDAKLETTPTQRAAGLGDFSRLWQEIGTTSALGDDKLHVSPDTVAIRDYATINPNHPPAPPLRDDTYASDGGYYSARKNVTWKDEPEYMDTTDIPTTPTSDEGPPNNLGSPFRNSGVQEPLNPVEAKREAKRAKKQRQKQRKLLEQLEEDKVRARKVVSDIESESEIRKLVKQTPASKASKHSKASTNAHPIRSQTEPPNDDSSRTHQNVNTAQAESSDNASKGKHKRTRSKDVGQSISVPSTPKKVSLPNHLLPSALPQHPTKSTPTQELSQSLQSQFTSNLPAHLPAITTPSRRPAQQVYPSITSLEQTSDTDADLFLARTSFALLEDQADSKIYPVSGICATKRGAMHEGTKLSQSRLPASALKRSQHHFPFVYPYVASQPTPGIPGHAMWTAASQLSFNRTAQPGNGHMVPSSAMAVLPGAMFPQHRTIHSVQPHSFRQSLSRKQSLTLHFSQQFQILDKEERDLQLFLRLIHEFSDDKKWLTRPVPMADHNSSATGIHVFVDFSNIWIGFMDHLKHLQMHMHQRIPHQNISFDALVLLLERKRPVAKRVLAGSYPLMPAMELAKQIGYETLILEKVYKSREPTERQRRMLALQSRNSFAALGTQGAPNGSSPMAALSTTPPNMATGPSISSAPIPAPEKWVEQGVDEILHLRILESIVDTDVPSRMVVATGDAAKAEYSEGFMKMIVRALKKGWSVELVAFSKSISGEYLKKTFRDEWNGKFEVVVLDRWAQFLLDT